MTGLASCLVHRLQAIAVAKGRRRSSPLIVYMLVVSTCHGVRSGEDAGKCAPGIRSMAGCSRGLKLKAPLRAQSTWDIAMGSASCCCDGRAAGPPMASGACRPAPAGPPKRTGKPVEPAH
jgi:hypothetical protein